LSEDMLSAIRSLITCRVKLCTRLCFFRSRDTVMSRAKFTRSARRTVYLYARPKVESRLSDLSNG